MYYTGYNGEQCEALEKTENVFGKNITTYKAEIGTCLFDVEVGTNGFKGGDAGHGSRTYIKLKTNEVVLLNSPDKHTVEMVAGGDWELASIKESLQWILDVLNKETE